MNKPIDFEVFREEELEKWSDITSATSYVDIASDMLNHFIYFQDKCLFTLVLAYSLVPSALAKRLPLLFLYGMSGTGKSTCGKLIAKIRGTSILSSSDTFASIRNYLEASKYENEYEKNCLLVWDDLDPRVLTEQEQIFRMLKVGYDRQTQWVSISGMKAGTNIRFGTFSPKVISTIHPIWTYPKLSELDRRSIVVPFVKLPSEVELMDLDSFSFQGLAQKYNAFWNDEQNCYSFSYTRKLFIRKKIEFLDNDSKQLMADIIATGIVFGIFADTKDGIKWLEDYWHNYLLPIKNKSSLAFTELLKEYLSHHEEVQKKMNLTLPISPKEILNISRMWADEGKIETYVTPLTLTDYMGKLGYKLTKNGWERMDK